MNHNYSQMNLFNELFNLFITLASYLLLNPQTQLLVYFPLLTPYQILNLNQLPN